MGCGTSSDTGSIAIESPQHTLSHTDMAMKGLRVSVKVCVHCCVFKNANSGLASAGQLNMERTIYSIGERRGININPTDVVPHWMCEQNTFASASDVGKIISQ